MKNYFHYFCFSPPQLVSNRIRSRSESQLGEQLIVPSGDIQDTVK
jgi:hypothetical protein